jgi:hypothetical protein
VGLPPRVFLYTVDQLAVLLNLPEQTLHTSHLFHEGRDVGIRDRHEMLARNIAKPDDKPDWRVSEKEFVRWLKIKGFKYYDTGTITS